MKDLEKFGASARVKGIYILMGLGQGGEIIWRHNGIIDGKEARSRIAEALTRYWELPADYMGIDAELTSLYSAFCAIHHLIYSPISFGK